MTIRDILRDILHGEGIEGGNDRSEVRKVELWNGAPILTTTGMFMNEKSRLAKPNLKFLALGPLQKRLIHDKIRYDSHRLKTTLDDKADKTAKPTKPTAHDYSPLHAT
ncbi:MAG: hypothetical protein MUC43_01565 [Pirellula sp.]|nr:hypothetical protein [Pirellula sp.]